MNEPDYQIRGVTLGDRDALLDLARFLDSVNLPADDPAAIEEAIERSDRSFSGVETDVRRRQYMFAIEHRPSGRIVGTSSILGQVGTREAPHIYFDVRTEERYSATLDRHFRHTKLQIGFSYDGPTAIGGLVVHPDHRRSEFRVGTQISLVRFLFIAMEREVFRDRLVAELLPPLASDGTSHLWEAVGRRFTDLSYREADRLSKKNKEFIRGLFPDGDIYASLLSPEAQAVIGQVGDQTRGVAKLLGQEGFRYANRVDPFDGGPYFEAATDRVRTVRHARELEVDPARGTASLGKAGHTATLVGRRFPKSPWFRAAVASPVEVAGAEALALPAPVWPPAGSGRPASPVWGAPLPRATSKKP